MNRYKSLKHVQHFDAYIRRIRGNKIKENIQFITFSNIINIKNILNTKELNITNY